MACYDLTLGVNWRTNKRYIIIGSSQEQTDEGGVSAWHL